VLSPVSTNFVRKLKANDQASWYELWENFAPIVRAQLAKWGKGRIGAETVQDLSQETMAALSESIDRFDPARGVRFSTWLLAIAKHVLGDELDRRNAQKRDAGRKAGPLEESWMVADPDLPVDEQYEAAVFRAKVEAALRSVSKECDLTDFEIFRRRVLEGEPGKDVAASLGVSEPTISRKCARVRELVRAKLANVVQMYSFTEDEEHEAERAGLALPKEHTPAEDARFDHALGEIYQLQAHARRRDAQGD
jgi:RNA polymerase sigma factor (sigma-70 family)